MFNLGRNLRLQQDNYEREVEFNLAIDVHKEISLLGELERKLRKRILAWERNSLTDSNNYKKIKEVQVDIKLLRGKLIEIEIANLG